MSIFLIFSHLIPITGCLLAVSLIARVNREQRSPAATIAWLLVILLLPFIGVPLYIMIGGRKMRRLAGEKADLVLPTRDTGLPPGLHLMDRLLQSYGLPGVTAGNRIRLCGTGEEIYTELIQLIDGADRSIHITTFILARDDVGRAVVDRLALKASQGVEVRLLLDGVGSYRASRRFLEPLVKAGGSKAFFMPVFHLPRSRTNLRNHRKMAVVDGWRVLAGGANLAGEYIGPTPNPDRWRDLAFVLEGPAVRDYERIFMADWEFASGRKLDLASMPTETRAGEEKGKLVHVLPSGPDVQGDPLYDLVLTAIFAAKSRLWIVTPYFVPDEGLAKALQIAAFRGVDVCLHMPEKSNHRLADIAGRPALRSIKSAGGRIRFHTDGMLHAKAMLMDDEMAVIGSANMDMRSLKINYEVMMVAYCDSVVRDTENWINRLNFHPGLIDEKPNTARDFGEGLVRMLAPLL